VGAGTEVGVLAGAKVGFEAAKWIDTGLTGFGLYNDGRIKDLGEGISTTSILSYTFKE
jgi:hypothetical protein